MLLQRLTGRAAAILIVCLFGTNVSYVAAQTRLPGQSELGGWVYIDRNNDGVLNFAPMPNPEWVIPNVTIELYSSSNLSTPLRTTQSDSFGRYFFGNLAPGTYGLKQIQPIEYVDGLDTYGKLQALTAAGVPPGTPTGSASNDAFSNITLPANVRGDYFNFGERGFALGYASKRFLEGFAPLMEFGEDDPAVVTPEPATVWLAMAAVGFGLVPPRRRRT